MMYKTAREAVIAETIEKRSRFIAHLSPVATAEAASSFINEIRREEADATHNVPAYILRDGSCRASDDGEPSGTAGIQVLAMIKKEEFVDVCIVVTRYFGGVLLGGGGLIRAYRDAAKAALDLAVPAFYYPSAKCVIEIPYSYKKVTERILDRDGIKTVSTMFTDIVTIDVIMKEDLTEAVRKDLAEFTNGSALMRVNCGIYETF